MVNLGSETQVNPVYVTKVKVSQLGFKRPRWMEENVDGTGLAVNKEVRLLCLSAISSANYIEYIQHGFYLDDLSHIYGLKPFQHVM